MPVVLLVVFAQSAWWTRALNTSNVGDTGAEAEAAARGQPPRAMHFVEALLGDASNLNPILYADSASGRAIAQVFEGLLTYDEKVELAPALAERWKIEHRAYLPLAGPDCSPGADATQALRASVATLLGGLAALRNADPSVAVLAPGDAPAHLVNDAASGGEKPAPAAANAWLAIQLSQVTPALEAMLVPALQGSPCSGDAATLAHRPTVTFTLRKDVSWHDGEPFDADDVRFTFEAIMDEATLSPRRADYVPVAALHTPDPHTVEVVYRDLYSPGLSIWTIGLLPEHRLNASALRAELGTDAPVIGDSSFNRAPTGTGPYRFAAWHGNREIVLERSPTYWRDAELPDAAPGVSLKGFVMRIMPDSFAQELEFLAGGLDTYDPEPYQVERYAQDPQYNLLSGPGFVYAYIGYNARRPPFDDARVRRALGLAVNVDDIIEYVLYGLGERATGPYARETPWNDPDVAPLPHDPQAAAQLLLDAGFERGPDGWLQRDGKRFEFNLITNNGNEKRRAILSIVQDSWQRIGVKVNTQLFEWSVFLKDFINAGEFDAVVLGWQMTPDFDLYQIWHSSQVGGRKLNFVSYRSSEADRLIEELRREYDGARIAAKAHALHARIAADQPYTFLYSQRKTRVMSRQLIEMGEDGRERAPTASNTGSRNVNLWRWRRGAALQP